MREWYLTSEYFIEEPESVYQLNIPTQRYNIICSDRQFIACKANGSEVNAYTDYKVVRNVILDESLIGLFQVVDEDEFKNHIVKREPMKFIIDALSMDSKPEYEGRYLTKMGYLPVYDLGYGAKIDDNFNPGDVTNRADGLNIRRLTRLFIHRVVEGDEVVEAHTLNL
jgi:hypothetical protein